MSNREVLAHARFILSNLHTGRELANAAHEIKNHLIDITLNGELSESDFYRITSVLTPQSRSPLWEKYFIRKHDCRRVNRNENRDDLEKNGWFYEFKASGFNRDEALHIVQIRLWQDCDYIIQAISDQGAVTFVLAHDEMQEETVLFPAHAARNRCE